MQQINHPAQVTMAQGGAVQRSPLPPQKLQQHPPTEKPPASYGDRAYQEKGEKR
ncbi:MAG: hypothetical protein AB4426_03500 [Xenococcaceae cyanobacterium]